LNSGASKNNWREGRISRERGIVYKSAGKEVMKIDVDNLSRAASKKELSVKRVK